MQNSIKSLNEAPTVSELVPLTYSMNVNGGMNVNGNVGNGGNVTKKTNEVPLFDLEQLVKRIKLDITFENGIPYYQRPAFISKSYFRSKTSSVSEYAYNYPEIPIPDYFECSECNQTKNHQVECLKPFESSLFVTSEGSSKLNVPEGTPYILAVKKRGQKKIYSPSPKVNRFTDNVQLIYEYPNFNKCTVRISAAGNINIISAAFDDVSLPKLVVSKINETGTLNLSEYQKLYPSLKKFTIDKSLSGITFIFGQFNLFPTQLKTDLFVNLKVLNKIILNNISDSLLTNYDGRSFVVRDYEFNSGNKLSRSSKQTNPYIKMNLIDNSFNANVMIYIRGSVQIKLSKLKGDKQVLEHIYTFLKTLLTELIINSEEPIIISDTTPVNKKKIKNTIDSHEPKMCHDRKGNKLRPVPYSFYGKCPQEGYWVDPEGVKRPDGLYEPCCKKIIKSGKGITVEKIKSMLVKGFPLPGFPDPDVLSSVYSPGTNIRESRRFKGMESLDREHLINCIAENGYIDSSVFAKDTDGNYQSLKQKVITELKGIKNAKLEYPVALTNDNISKFNESYLVTPINENTIPVLLFFNQLGESYFINGNNDISESSLPIIQVLAVTLISGYLYPYEEQLVFYPIDILYISGKDITKLDYYLGNVDSRFHNLMYSLNLININGLQQSQLDIQANRFDLNLIPGAKNFLTNDEYSIYGKVSGLLFIPSKGAYQPGKNNNNLLLWTDILRSSSREFSAQIAEIEGSSVRLEVENREISNSVKISKVFINKNKLKVGDKVLFRINVDYAGAIDQRVPFIPLKVIPEQLYTYSEVINIINAIKNPIPRQYFLN